MHVQERLQLIGYNDHSHLDFAIDFLDTSNIKQEKTKVYRIEQKLSTFSLHE